MGNCASLTSVQLPPNIEEVEDNVFWDCTSLTELDMSSLMALSCSRLSFHPPSMKQDEGF